MKKSLILAGLAILLISGCSTKGIGNSSSGGNISSYTQNNQTLTRNNVLIFKVVGQGVAPVNTISPAQAKALAKRAAIADAYRQLAEKIAGVKIEGRDKIVNMVTKKSLVRTCVNALIKNATIIDSAAKDGLYEVEMEIKMYGKDWYPLFASN
ncbi:LPP20 family lipoprotein [Hydrogenimonas thermophila]|uniref:Lipoprotein LPP20-like domain-containing protein n=1 Tax=Hydrogenimonas thermophila TaxID=223786 RepID=A0A1I5LV95_9BACT|nr:LPP20 family lipoprotein [Hydrogenimonas thermophila]WOE70456.1 LPP20 family lipoprotein [Hydrogenimonas thermophila]WOE72973.1 LPP20 family lipoprotein [Hydrogenimonas thermophila]SFP01258.1 hypothetical protein SAMN05216234_10432 [Hydrogenimonas thermophila]